MKTVTVQYFAAFRDQAGVGSETVTSSAATLTELFDELCRRHHRLTPLGQMKVAVNDELADWSASLHDGDRVLLFPPVAGG